MRNKLIEARKAKGYTQKLLAKAIGMTNVGYAKIEHGERDGTIDTWRKIVSVLSIPKREAWAMMEER